MRLLPIALTLAFASCAWAGDPATQPARRGPPAASLATAYSGPVKFSDLRVLAAERTGSYTNDPVTRAATWRYYYSYPRGYYYGGCGWYWYGYGCGYGPCYRPYITTVAYHGEF